MRFLLAIDGSDSAYEAVRAMKHLTRADEMTLLHVLDFPKLAYPRMMPEVARNLYADLELAMTEEGERLLERIRMLLPLDCGPVTKRLIAGSPSNLIIATAESVQADLIVMGARGLGPVKERLLGSISHRVLTGALCAKLIVASPIQSMNRILLPLQGPADAEAAINFLKRKPFRGPVELTLVTVLPPTRPPWPVSNTAAEELEARALESAKYFMDDVIGQMQAIGYPARGMAALGTPAVTILEQAGKVRPDLILMGSHGRSGLTRFVLGSVSHAVLHQARYPVLVFQ
jgi:nucleotide-binding universal stress UspA family protein